MVIMSVKSESDSESDSDTSVESDSDVIMTDKYDMRLSRLSYSGNPDDDLQSFMSKFNDYAILRDFTAAKTFLALKTCISGHARVFLDTVNPTEKDSVIKIEALLSTNFEGPAWKWNIESQLLNRKQQPSENLDNYASDIMLWCKQSKKSQAETMSLFLRGLLPSLRGFVMTKQPESFQAALEAARLGIAVQNCNQPSIPTSSAQANVVCPPEVNVFQSTVETLTGLVKDMSTRLEKLEVTESKPQQSNTQTQGTRSNNKLRPQRSVICWRCGFPGHRRANCYAIRDRDGRPLN